MGQEQTSLGLLLGLILNANCYLGLWRFLTVHVFSKNKERDYLIVFFYLLKNINIDRTTKVDLI